MGESIKTHDLFQPVQLRIHAAPPDRPATNLPVDDGAVPIGVPSFIPRAPGFGAAGHMYVTVRRAHFNLYVKPPNKNVHTFRPPSLLRYLMTVMEVSKTVRSGQLVRSRRACSLSFVPAAGGELAAAAAVTDEKETLRLGHLLGKCAYGSVYSSLWRGVPVAVKVWG